MSESGFFDFGAFCGGLGGSGRFTTKHTDNGGIGFIAIGGGGGCGSVGIPYKGPDENGDYTLTIPARLSKVLGGKIKVVFEDDGDQA